MNNLHYDYSIGWFTDCLDQKYENEKKFINVHLPMGNNRLERGKKLFLAMAKECERRSFFIRFVVTDPTIKFGQEGDWLIDREEVIETKTLKQYLGLGTNSLTISENHEVRLQAMYLQELESRKDLNQDYDIYITDYGYPDRVLGEFAEYNNTVASFREYVIQKLPKDGLIISFEFTLEQSGAINSTWARFQSDNLRLIHPPTLIKNQRSEFPMRYEVWEKAQAKV
jgi:hypothetical protein